MPTSHNDSMKRILALIAMTLISSHAQRWKVGESFPALTLPTIDGKASPQVTDFRGKKLMLHAFASW
jgi:hypothetical protein